MVIGADINKSGSVPITKKLEKEMDQVSSLREILTRSKQVASNVGTILDSFDHRLAKLETTILPVYQQTGNLQRRQTNTEKTLKSLDYVIGFYNVAGEVEGIICERPSSIGVSKYLGAMDKIMAASQFFESNNPQAIELENLKSRYETGCQQLSIEFRDELKKYQKPLPPVVILELLELDESELNEETLDSLDLVPMSVRDDLCSIAAWLDQNSPTDRLTVYAKQRAYAILESLKGLRAFSRSNSGDRGPSSANSSFSSVGSPGFGRTKNSRLDISRLKSNTISQRATRALMRAMPVQTSRRQGAATATEEFLDEMDIAIYLNQVTALHRLATMELLLCKQLIPADKVTRIFELIIRDSINDLAVEGENLAFQAHRNVTRGELQAILSLLSLLKHMTLMQKQYDVMLSKCQVSFRTKFAAIVHTLQDTTAKALDGFVMNLKSEADRSVPRDGTVHQLTSNTVIFVEQLLDFSNTLAPILQKEAIFSTDKVPADQRPKLYLGMYIKRVLSNLGFALAQRSSFYNDSTLCAIFCLNNYNYILKSLQNSEILSAFSLAEPDCCQTYMNLILEQKSVYSECLKKLLYHIDTNDDIPPHILKSGKLRDRDRQNIKDKFSGFNKDIEEMQRVQRGYSIPDLELRQSMKRDNKENVLPKYQAFYDRYSQLQFSKNPEKYIRYTPADVSHKLDEFFDVAA